MSIASYSVVGRILTEVQASPIPPELGPRVRRERGDEIFELRRSRCLHTPPFATPFHFWAHALRDLLEERGRVDLLEAMATHGLCRVEDPDEAVSAMRALAARLDSQDPLPARATAGYRMIDQDVMASWVAEADDEFVACFWLRSDWLADAFPFDPEEEDDEAGPAETEG